jgi:hypothetical protein
MTRIITVAVVMAFVAGVVTTYGMRDGALILAAFAAVAAFAVALVYVRRWAMRDCGDARPCSPRQQSAG